MKTYADIAKDQSLTVAVVSGANNVDFLRAVGVKDEQIVFIPANADAILTVQSCTDAYAATELTVAALAKAAGLTEQVASVHGPDRQGCRLQLWWLCLPPGRHELQDAFNAASQVPHDG